MTASLLGPRLKTRGLKEERDLVFLIAQIKWDPSIDIHLRALQTCYLALLDDASVCPAYGSHWERIGFQVTLSHVLFSLQRFHSIRRGWTFNIFSLHAYTPFLWFFLLFIYIWHVWVRVAILPRTWTGLWVCSQSFKWSTSLKRTAAKQHNSFNFWLRQTNSIQIHSFVLHSDFPSIPLARCVEALYTTSGKLRLELSVLPCTHAAVSWSERSMYTNHSFSMTVAERTAYCR